MKNNTKYKDIKKNNVIPIAKYNKYEFLTLTYNIHPIITDIILNNTSNPDDTIPGKNPGVGVSSMIVN